MTRNGVTAQPRDLVIAAYDIKVPLDFFPIPLAGDDEIDSARWARGVVDEVLDGLDAPSEEGDIVEHLVELRRRLLAGQNAQLTAAVSIRPEGVLTVGCLLTTEQFGMDADDDADTFEQMLTEGVRQLRPGARTRVAETWRSDAEVGEIVGLFHRIDFIELGDEEGTLEQRTVLGVFPPRSRDMIRFIFTVADFATFSDMKADTQAIVETVEVTLQEASE